MIALVVGAITTVIAGAWLLLTLAGKQWEKRQELQFAALNKGIQDLQNRMEGHYAGLARLELKLSESEKNALLNFALKRDLEAAERVLDQRVIAILVEVRDMSKRMDEWLKAIAGYMDRSTDRNNTRP